MVIEAGSQPEQLANYIRSLGEFERYTLPDGNYRHIGATLADAVLQSNNNYLRNVQPRVERIRREYPHETSLQDIKRLLAKITAQEFLNWNGTRKPKTFHDLIDLLQQEHVNTEDDLRQWLQQGDSKEKLLKIPFIGQKTVDYLKGLVGLDEAAMDRHLLGFIERAGLGRLNYQRAKEIVHRTADLMGWKRAHLDYSIWRYMSDGKRG
jgi:hypothetical protein